ncbi:MAG: hypothetical protein P4L64_07075 [Caulobacteraceae bacterium]|nr:hypothetical protein [Caulobacteraceae bacterium]
MALATVAKRSTGRFDNVDIPINKFPGWARLTILVVGAAVSWGLVFLGVALLFRK